MDVVACVAGELSDSAGLREAAERGGDLLQFVDDSGRTGARLAGLQGADLAYSAFQAINGGDQ